MWLQWYEVEHGRNHLITGQLCEPLTSAREITINVNDSQDTLYNLLSVNRCSDVEHLVDSIDQRSMMWTYVKSKRNYH